MEFKRPDYIYRCTVDRVIDGDTVDVTIDVGFKTNMFKRIRFLGIDTEELRGGTVESKARAVEAKERVQELVDGADRCYLQTVMDTEGKYGRLLGYLWVEKDEVLTNVNQLLVEEGFEKIR